MDGDDDKKDESESAAGKSLSSTFGKKKKSVKGKKSKGETDNIVVAIAIKPS